MWCTELFVITYESGFETIYLQYHVIKVQLQVFAQISNGRREAGLDLLFRLMALLYDGLEVRSETENRERQRTVLLRHASVRPQVRGAWREVTGPSLSRLKDLGLEKQILSKRDIFFQPSPIYQIVLSFPTQIPLCTWKRHKIDCLRGRGHKPAVLAAPSE